MKEVSSSSTSPFAPSIACCLALPGILLPPPKSLILFLELLRPFKTQEEADPALQGRTSISCRRGSEGEGEDGRRNKRRVQSRGSLIRGVTLAARIFGIYYLLNSFCCDFFGFLLFDSLSTFAKNGETHCFSVSFPFDKKKGGGMNVLAEQDKTWCNKLSSFKLLTKQKVGGGEFLSHKKM